jgi:hypothetical protein
MSRISRLICDASRKRYWGTSHRRGVNPLRRISTRRAPPIWRARHAFIVPFVMAPGAGGGPQQSLPYWLATSLRSAAAASGVVVQGGRYPRRAWPLVRCVGDCVAAAVACTVFWCAGRRRWGCCRRQTVLASVLAAVTALAALSAPLHVPGAGGYRSDRDCRGRVGRVW